MCIGYSLCIGIVSYTISWFVISIVTYMVRDLYIPLFNGRPLCEFDVLLYITKHCWGVVLLLHISTLDRCNLWIEYISNYKYMIEWIRTSTNFNTWMVISIYILPFTNTNSISKESQMTSKIHSHELIHDRIYWRILSQVHSDILKQFSRSLYLIWFERELHQVVEHFKLPVSSGHWNRYYYHARYTTHDCRTIHSCIIIT